MPDSPRPAERITYLTGLTSGANTDHRCTPLTEQLPTDLLNALRDPALTPLGGVL
ncbi:hypothetical protein ACIO93_35935 [Streptomyces sp. NPDC087903]|uniref:hypothetical protein n=1 Tax=Streptomyces sp. NPDC087903 TaxID=3365819 RepID=UPI0037FBF0C1